MGVGATKLHPEAMRRVFGAFLLVISVHLLIGHRS
jgi:hypothetical protein